MAEPRDERFDVPDVVAEGLKRFALCSDAEKEQRKSILAAKKFRAGDQWEDAVKIQRQGGPAVTGVAAQPQRPCLTIDRISPAVRQVSNTIKNANITASVSPNGGKATKEEADILKDWMRRVQNDARGEAPIEWAADGAAEGGIGWFRLRTDFIDNAIGESVFDQDAKLERIANNLTVYCDPSAKMPTRRDARFMFVTEDIPRTEFKRRWPKAKLTTLDEFRGLGDGEGWATQDIVRVAEYWHVTYSDTRVIQLASGEILSGEDIPKDLDKKDIKHDRTIQTPTYVCDKINALEVLESYTWVGERIPLWPILGEELNVDGKTVLRGVVQPAMDPQRMVNYTYSAAIETAALEPKAPWVATTAAIGNYKAMWQTANVTNYSALYWDEYGSDAMGQQKNSPPFRTPAGANIGAFVEMMLRSEEAVKTTTNIFDPSLGKSDPKERSGKAIQALQGQAEHANSNFLSNTQMAVLDLAQEMVCIAPKILDRPGRVLAVLGLDDQARHVMLGQPFKEGANGQPEAIVGPDGKPLAPEEMQTLEAGMAKFYDLSRGKYGVTVTTSKSYLTRQQEGAEAMGQLIPNLPPPMAAAITPSFIRSLDFPQNEKIAEIAESALPPELQPKDEQGGELPPQAKAIIQQLQGQLQMMGQQLQEANSGLPAKQLEVQGRLQQTQMEIESKERIEREKIAADERKAAMDNQTKLIIAGQQMDVQRGKVMAEIDRTMADQAQATMEHATQHGHEQTIQARDHAHEKALAQHAVDNAPDPAQNNGAKA